MDQPCVLAMLEYTSGDTDGSITAASPAEPTTYDRHPLPVRRT